MNVLVFRTNIGCPGCLEMARQALHPFHDNIRWTVDLDDCDRVLRIVPAYSGKQTVTSDAVIDALNSAGIICEELI